VYESNTVQQVLDTVRRIGKNSETIDVIYVINEKGELLDDIRIREFILALPDIKVKDLMDDRVIGPECLPGPGRSRRSIQNE
jgi:magnesium transporter